jgi:hypothetical protein
MPIDFLFQGINISQTNCETPSPSSVTPDESSCLCLKSFENLGTGIGVFKEISNGVVKFKTLVAGNNISIVETNTELTIAGTGGGGGNTLAGLSDVSFTGLATNQLLQYNGNSSFILYKAVSILHLIHFL